MRRLAANLPILLSLILAACATTPPTAPAPLKSVDTATFFTGRWYEITRTPNFFVKNCVSGTTDFLTTPDGKLIERDQCRRGNPAGSIKSFQGPIVFTDNGQHNEFTVHYTLYGFIPFSQPYWILDHAADYSWFIVETPSFQEVSVLSRTPRPPAAETAKHVGELRSLGYDTSKLEYPPLFPPGQG